MRVLRLLWRSSRKPTCLVTHRITVPHVQLAQLDLTQNESNLTQVAPTCDRDRNFAATPAVVLSGKTAGLRRLAAVQCSDVHLPSMNLNEPLMALPL